MAGKKLTRKDPLAEARAARAELRAGVANAVNDALPVVGSDSNAWGGKLNQFLIDTLVLLVSKVSSINGVTPNPATGDIDLSGVYVAYDAGTSTFLFEGSPVALPASASAIAGWAADQAYSITSATRDGNGAITAATVTWPDGTTGTLTADTVSTVALGKLDAYHVTYGSPALYTFTQPLVTRDVQGNITAQPSIAVTVGYKSWPVSSQAAMLALSSAVVGDLAARSDLARTYQLTATPASTLGNWQLLPGPTGLTGAAGPANVLNIGSVSTLAAGASATASLTGSAPSQTLNFGLPTGATGATGATGPAAQTSAAVITASTAAWAIPSWATKLKVTCVGGGGGGGGGGSAGATQLQAGGAGGASGTCSTRVVSVGSNTTLNVAIGASGAGGAGGAAGGNTGLVGGNGSPTQVTGTGINVIGAGGTSGAFTTASSTAAAAGGLYGSGGRSSTTTAGCGAASAFTGGAGVAESPAGGGGGGAATATNGGGGGAAGTAASNSGGAGGGSGASGTSAGVNGASGVDPGSGGGGGGGGAAGTGKGGDGGAGAPGFAIIEAFA